MRVERPRSGAAFEHLATGEAHLLLAYLPGAQRALLAHALDCPDCRPLLDELLREPAETARATAAAAQEAAAHPAPAPLLGILTWATIARVCWSEGKWAETRAALEGTERALVLAQREAASGACRDLFAAVRLVEQQIEADFALVFQAVEQLLRCALDPPPPPAAEEDPP